MNTAKQHVLIVDDDRNIREPLARFLEANGLDVSSADSAAAARRELAGSRIDLVVLDIMMPGEDGLALCRSLRQEGLTIIMVEHVMDAIRSLCDRCIVMNAGRKIAEGPAAAVLADADVIRAYLGDADA